MFVKNVIQGRDYGNVSTEFKLVLNVDRNVTALLLLFHGESEKKTHFPYWSFRVLNVLHTILDGLIVSEKILRRSLTESKLVENSASGFVAAHIRRGTFEVGIIIFRVIIGTYMSYEIYKLIYHLYFSEKRNFNCYFCSGAIFSMVIHFLYQIGYCSYPGFVAEINKAKLRAQAKIGQFTIIWNVAKNECSSTVRVAFPCRKSNRTPDSPWARAFSRSLAHFPRFRGF